MTNRVENYTLSCPCRDIIIEGDLIKTHGDRHSMPEPGAIVNCPCGCLHRVTVVERDAHLVVVERLDLDEQIAVYADMGMHLAKAGCPHCDEVTITEIPPHLLAKGFDALRGAICECPDCHKTFVVDGLDGHDLRTRDLTDDERAYLRAQLAAASRARAFGSWGSGAGAAKGATPFGADPFSPFGRGDAS